MKKKPWIIGIAATAMLLFAAKGISWYRWSQLSSAEKAGAITEKMARRLDLDANQKEQIYALNLEKIQAFETARQSGTHKRADWKNLRESWKNEVRGVLNPEQQQKFWN